VITQTSLTKTGWRYEIRDAEDDMLMCHAGGFRSESEAQLAALAWIDRWNRDRAAARGVSK
jgi:hypothetical protein